MTRKILFTITAIGLLCNGSSLAMAKKKRKPMVAARLVEAYTQRTLAGIPGQPPKTTTQLVIVWDGPKSPETFFWRGENGWMPCTIAAAHRIPTTANTETMYSTKELAGGSIKKGDTLLLTPVAGGKFPIPEGIPADAQNTLYYQMGGNGWVALPVGALAKRRDIPKR